MMQLCPQLSSACCPQALREFAAQLSKQLGLDVYTFSIFHVFFEQYLGIRGTAIRLLGALISTDSLISPLTCWRLRSCEHGHTTAGHPQTVASSCRQPWFSPARAFTRPLCLRAGGVQVAIFAAAWLLLGSAWGAGLMTAVIASMLVR
jgi:hypothetical protein